MGFKADQKKVRDLFSKNLYIIPRNQRQYVWTKDNWNELFSDINYSITQNSSHFIGSIVLKKEEEKSGLATYTIIDGQQRIMTITIFLAVLLYEMKKTGLEDDFKGSLKYIIATDDSNKKHEVFYSEYHMTLSKIINSYLELNLSKNDTVSAFLNTKIINPKKDKSIVDCFLYFYNEIESRCNNNKEKIKMFVLKLRDSLLNITYVNIAADTEEDSYTVFEILNARGQSLLEHELIKNFIMRYKTPISTRDSAKIEWEDMTNRLGYKGLSYYINHYVIHKFPYSEKFRSQAYSNIKYNVKLEEVNTFFDDLLLKSKYYEKILNPKELDENGNRFCSKLEYQTFSFFKSKRQEQFRPLLLSLMHLVEKEKITNKQYEDLIKFIKHFFICYTLIGKEKSNTITSIIAKYAYNFENSFSDNLLDDFKNSLKVRIPDSNWFVNKFKQLAWSNHNPLLHDEKEKSKIQFALELYEQYLAGTTDSLTFTIEHILPDSQGAVNAQIGNLLPLEKELNDKCKDKSFAEKIIFYQQSNFSTVKIFLERYKNGFESTDIDKRQSNLAKDFYEHIIR